MARCAGCSGVVHGNTNCIHLAGAGTSLDPLLATPVISPDAGNELVCRANGLFSPPGGGGGGGKQLYFTVGTPGPNGFGGVGGTPAPLLATADYVGDGINDSVAIQAAIDASEAFTLTTGEGVVVLILPGIFVVNTPLRPKGIPIKGQEAAYTLFYTATFLGAPANTRTLDATISGQQVTHIEGIQISSLTGGAAVIKSQSLIMLNCTVLGDGKGADAGLIDVGNIISPTNGYGSFDNNIVGGTSSPFPDPGLILRDPFGSNYSIRYSTFTADLVVTGSNHNNGNIVDNTFQNCNIVLNSTSLTRFSIRNNTISGGSITATLVGGSSFFWTIEGNIIEFGHISIDSLIISKIRGNIVSAFLKGNAIELSNSGENIIEGNTIDQAEHHGILLTTANFTSVIGNRIRAFSNGTFNTFDGIRIVTSDDCTVECNSLTSSTGKYGINVLSGTANYVTNNRLNGSAVTASFIDTGAGTIVAAGNYL